MARRADGEFEILLGNKQLLSVFFIVVILLAIFFTMGYMLGRNAGSAVASAQRQVQAPVEGRASGFDAKPSASQMPAPSAAKAEEQPSGIPEEKKFSEAPAPQQAATAVSEAPAAPAPGQVFLQATAGKPRDAELVAGVLRKKGFPVVLAPGPTDTVLRVLVGPLPDSEAVAKTRAELEAAGFKPFIRRY